MEIPEQRKLDVVMAQLQERYEASHKMRDRSMQVVLWILGFGLGMGWLLISETPLSCSQQVAITIFLLLLNIVTLWFVSAIRRGFENNRQIVIRLETILKLHELNSYGIAESVLPRKYSEMKRRWTGHFETLYAIILVVLISLIVLTWTNPCKPMSAESSGVADLKQTETVADN